MFCKHSKNFNLEGSPLPQLVALAELKSSFYPTIHPKQWGEEMNSFISQKHKHVQAHSLVKNLNKAYWYYYSLKYIIVIINIISVEIVKYISKR